MNHKRDLLLIISSIIIGAILMFLVMINIPIINKTNRIESNIYEKNSLSQSVKKIYDAVVVVESLIGNSVDSTGTGFIYKVDNKYAYILTNEHVLKIEDDLKIILSTDEEVEPVLLGKDEYLDLAVLRIDKKYASLVATIGSSEKMNLGDTVFTVGTPVGNDYKGSVTSGVLSGKDRMISTTVSNSDNSEWIMKVLQVDAAINPGNSGGPLLNINGEVIGICTLKLVNAEIEGMGFAIPIEYAMNHIDELEKSEKIKWPKLGVSIANVNDYASLNNKNIDIPSDIREGAVITKVDNKSSAYKAGLKVGDVITKLDDLKIKDTIYLRYGLYQYKAGDTIEITYIRNNKEKTTKVTIENMK